MNPKKVDIVVVHNLCLTLELSDAYMCPRIAELATLSVRSSDWLGGIFMCIKNFTNW